MKIIYRKLTILLLLLILCVYTNVYCKNSFTFNHLSKEFNIERDFIHKQYRFIFKVHYLLNKEADKAYVIYSDYHTNKSHIVILKVDDKYTNDTITNIHLFQYVKNELVYTKVIDNKKNLYLYKADSDDKLIFNPSETFSGSYLFEHNSQILQYIYNAFYTKVITLNNNFDVIDTIYSDTKILDTKYYINSIVWKVIQNGKYRYVRYDSKGVTSNIFQYNDIINELLYDENENIKIIAIDSLNVNKIRFYKDDKLNVEVVYPKHYITDISIDSNISYTIANKVESFKFNLDSNFNLIDVDTLFNLQDYKIEKVIVDRENYSILYYKVSNPKYLKPKAILMETYGGYNQKRLQFELRDIDKKLLDDGFEINYCSTSGDGEISWTNYLNGIQDKLPNVAGDIHSIVLDIKSKIKTDIPFYGRTFSFGSYVMLIESFKYETDFDKVFMGVGEYDYILTIQHSPHRQEQLGFFSDSIMAMHNKINPINNGLVNNHTEYLIVNYENDKTVNNASVLNLIDYFNEKNINYKFKLIRNRNHNRLLDSEVGKNDLTELEYEFFRLK